VGQAKPEGQGLLRHLQECRAHPNPDRLDYLSALGLAQVQKQNGLGTPATHSPGANHAPGAFGPMGLALQSTT